MSNSWQDLSPEERVRRIREDRDDNPFVLPEKINPEDLKLSLGNKSAEDYERLGIKEFLVQRSLHRLVGALIYPNLINNTLTAVHLESFRDAYEDYSGTSLPKNIDQGLELLLSDEKLRHDIATILKRDLNARIIGNNI